MEDRQEEGRRLPKRRGCGEYAVKAAVRRRDGYRCKQFGMSQEKHVRRYSRILDVHRLAPGSVYTVVGCITVCRKCHGPLPRREQADHGRMVLFPPPDLAERLRNYVLWTPGAGLGALLRRAAARMMDLVERQENGGKPWPPRRGRLKTGRPIS